MLVNAKSGDSDYVNASVIKLARDRTYIVTQAPMPTTVNDMWRLVWDYNVTNIIMLMDLLEGNKLEVDRYWPLHGQAQNYGDVSIQVMINNVDRLKCITDTWTWCQKQTDVVKERHGEVSPMSALYKHVFQNASCKQSKLLGACCPSASEVMSV